MDSIEVSFNSVLSTLPIIERVVTKGDDSVQEEDDAVVLAADIERDLQDLDDAAVADLFNNLVGSPRAAPMTDVCTTVAQTTQTINPILNLQLLAGMMCDNVNVRHFIQRRMFERDPALLALSAAVHTTRELLMKILKVWLQFGARLDLKAVADCNPAILLEKNNVRVLAGLNILKIQNQELPIHEQLRDELVPILLQILDRLI